MDIYFSKIEQNDWRICPDIVLSGRKQYRPETAVNINFARVLPPETSGFCLILTRKYEADFMFYVFKVEIKFLGVASLAKLYPARKFYPDSFALVWKKMREFVSVQEKISVLNWKMQPHFT